MSSALASISFASATRLQLEVRWLGRLIDLEQFAPGAITTVAGRAITWTTGGVVVDGVPHPPSVDGEVVFHSGPLQIRALPVAAVVAARGAASVDLRWWRTMASAVTIAVGVMAAAWLTQARPDFADEGLQRSKTTFTRVAVSPHRPVPTPTKVVQRRTHKPSQSMAKTTATPTTPKARRDRAHAEAIDAVKAMGLGGGAVATVFATGARIDDALKGLSAPTVAGLGSDVGSRHGPGGGHGTTIGIGVLGSGLRPGTGSEVAVGLIGRRHVGVTVGGGRTVVVGSLDRGEIQRVMDRAKNRIRYCYERALTKSPDLEGKLTTVFTIGGSGDVVSANQVDSTLGAEVDGCVLRTLRSLKFPNPRGGGVVTVTYPFIFSAH